MPFTGSTTGSIRGGGSSIFSDDVGTVACNGEKINFGQIFACHKWFISSAGIYVLDGSFDMTMTDFIIHRVINSLVCYHFQVWSNN